MIEKDESGGHITLELALSPPAKDAIFGTNEIGDLNFKNQIYLGDIMEEGVAHISKYTIDAEMIVCILSILTVKIFLKICYLYVVSDVAN